MTDNDRNAYWYAVYVRSRYEKKVNRDFIDKRIECFLPLLETWRQWSDRKKRVSEPLFRGYVFVRIDMKSEHVKVLDTDGVVKFIGIGKTPSVISNRDIDWIRKLVREPDAVRGAVNLLPPGQKVRVTAGPFKGLEGVVMKAGRESRLVVYFEGIMQGIEVSIFPELLAPLHACDRNSDRDHSEG